LTFPRFDGINSQPIQPLGELVMKGETLTRADLCEAVHEEVGLSRQECSALVERTLELIAEALERGETVKLSGFGVFQVREKRARMGRNPKTGEPAAIDPRRVISFRASQVMKARVDGSGGAVVLDHEAA
jgi:integration host factor subunit alpha